jgi:hypothetical protein
MSNNKKIRVAINGAAGRMGRRLIALATETPELELVAALESPGNSQLGADAGELAGLGRLGIKVTEKLPAAGADVLVDFSLPAGTLARLAECAAAGVAMVIGTTGLDRAAEETIAAAAKKIAIVKAPNMSVGVNVLLKTAAQVAKALGPDYDIEIVEALPAAPPWPWPAPSPPPPAATSPPTPATAAKEPPRAAPAKSASTPSAPATSSGSIASTWPPSANGSNSATSPPRATPSLAAPSVPPSGWPAAQPDFIPCRTFSVFNLSQKNRRTKPRPPG